MIQDIKNKFPIFNHHPSLVYLDSASSSQTPKQVLDAMNDYYTKYRANIHRGLYGISEHAGHAYESARVSVANLLNAEPNEIMFTSGTTHGLNLLAAKLTETLEAGDSVVLSRLEHHANLIPWQEAAKRRKFTIRFFEESLEGIDENTKIVSFTLISNALGTMLPAKEIIEKAKRVGAITIIDAAQAVAHLPIDVKALDCDFLVFSGHKMYGPTGIGVLYGKAAQLKALDPFFFGGDMIREVSYESATWADAPQKFEGGTPNIAGAIGLGAATDFLKELTLNTIVRHEQELTKELLEGLQTILGCTVVGNKTQENRIGVVSFTLDGIHPHDVAEILNREHVAVRSGYHCAMPLMKRLGMVGTVRVSIGSYTTNEDIAKLIKGLHKTQRIFSV